MQLGAAVLFTLLGNKGFFKVWGKLRKCFRHFRHEITEIWSRKTWKPLKGSGGIKLYPLRRPVDEFKKTVSAEVKEKRCIPGRTIGFDNLRLPEPYRYLHPIETGTKYNPAFF